MPKSGDLSSLLHDSRTVIGRVETTPHITTDTTETEPQFMRGWRKFPQVAEVEMWMPPTGISQKPKTAVTEHNNLEIHILRKMYLDLDWIEPRGSKLKAGTIFYDERQSSLINTVDVECNVAKALVAGCTVLTSNDLPVHVRKMYIQLPPRTTFPLPPGLLLCSGAKTMFTSILCISSTRRVLRNGHCR